MFNLSIHSPYTPKMPLSILSLNVNGLNHPAKRHSLWENCQRPTKRHHCVQETHLLPSNTSLCKNNHFPYIYNASYNTKTKGVLIAIRDTVDLHLTNALADPNGCFIILVCSIQKVAFTLICLCPNTHQMQFHRRVLRTAQPIQKGP